MQRLAKPTNPYRINQLFNNKKEEAPISAIDNIPLKDVSTR